MASHRSSYTRGLSFAALSTVALAGVGVVSSIAIARAYGVHSIGQYTLAIAPGLALTYLSTTQEQTALIRMLAVLPARSPRIAALSYATFSFSFALTVSVGLITLGVTYLVFHGPVDHPGLFTLAAADTSAWVLIVNTCWNLDSIFMAFRAGRELFWARLLQAVAFPVFAVAASFQSNSAWWLVLAGAASWGVSLAYRLAVVRRYMRPRIPLVEVRGGFRELPEMIRFGLKLTPGGIAAGVSSQIGVWVLGAIGTLSAVGAYGRAWRLSSFLLTANTRISEMLLPTLVERDDRGDQAGFDRAVGESMRYGTAALLLPAAVGGGAAVGVMEIFGPGFEQGADALAILLLVPALAALLGIPGQSLLTAVGKPGISTLVSIARVLVVLAITVPLTLWLGAAGTGLALVLGSIVMLPVAVQLTRRYTSGPISRWYGPRDIIAVLLAYAAGFVAARAVDSAIETIGGVAVALAAGVAAYAMAFLAAGGVRPRDLDRLGDILRSRGLQRPRALGGTSRDAP